MLVTVTACQKKDKGFVIATDTIFASFEFQNAQGQYVGIDIELLEAVAKDQGFIYGEGLISPTLCVLRQLVGEALLGLEAVCPYG